MTGDFREALIDVSAMRHNLGVLRRAVGGGPVLAVVKADAYGHGVGIAARALVDAGADWLGVADLEEAVALRASGITGPILCWLHGPETDFRPAVDLGIDVAVSSLGQLERVAAAVPEASTAHVHVKLETGLSRNGVAPERAPELFSRAAVLERAGRIRVRGLMTHVSNTSPEEDRRALDVFDGLVARAREEGLRPPVLHAAATAAGIRLPESRYDLVRLGIGLYGLSPFDDETSEDLGLRPVMTLRARVAAVRRVPAGTGLSYGYTYRTERETTLALVPLGYADGIPRAASGRGPVRIGGRTYTASGRIAMDQFIVDVGDAAVEVGDEAVLFGDPAAGAPPVEDWADAAGTINYEIVTRIGPRVPRVAVRGDEASA